MRIYLIGYMGSGKTTVGRELAAILKIPFVDLDEMIVQEAGMDIVSVFSKKGEKKFRILEEKCLRQTVRHKKAVIATGGGAPCFHNNMEWMNENGITVYFQVPEGVLFHRLSHDKANRPLIREVPDLSLMELIMDHLAVREKFYSKAHHVVDGTKLKAEKLPSMLGLTKNKK